MNSKLVDSLVQVIESLSEAARELLHQRLNQKQVWKAVRQQLYAIHMQIIQLPATERLQVLQQALSAAQAIQNESDRADALAAPWANCTHY